VYTHKKVQVKKREKRGDNSKKEKRRGGCLLRCSFLVKRLRFSFRFQGLSRFPHKILQDKNTYSLLVGCLWGRQIFLLLVAGKEEQASKHSSYKQLSAERDLACVGSLSVQEKGLG